MAVAYPTDLPIPLITGFSNQDIAGNRIYAVETGPPIIEKEFNDRPTKFKVTWLLTPLQFQVFEGFYKHELNFGANTFDMKISIGAGLISHELSFQLPYRSQLVGKLWRVSADLIARVKQRDDLATYQACKAEILPPGEVGDVYWSLDQPSGYLYRTSNGQSFQIASPIALTSGDTVSFNLYTTGPSVSNEPLAQSSSGASNAFSIEMAANGVINFEGCTVTVNGESVTNGQTNVFAFADVFNIVATITVTTDIEYLHYDGVSVFSNDIQIDELTVDDGTNVHHWSLNSSRLAAQPEENAGGNDITINSHLAASWRDKAWNTNEAAEKLSGIADAVYNVATLDDRIIAGGASLREDGAGSSFDFNSTAQIRIDADFLYQDGFTIEYLMRGDAAQQASPSTQGQMVIGSNATNNLLQDTLWCLRFDDYDGPGLGLKPCFTILSRDTIYSVETDNPTNVEVEVRGTTNIVLGDSYHILATFRPSNNTIELWVDGASIGEATIPTDWWDDGGQPSRDIRDGSDTTVIDFGIGYIDGAWRTGNTAMQDIRIHFLEADDNFATKQYNANKPDKT